MKLIQADFRRVNTSVYQTVWVDASWKLKPGQVVTFKNDEDRKWEVRVVYTNEIEMSDINQRWGLDLPASQRTER